MGVGVQPEAEPRTDDFEVVIGTTGAPGRDVRKIESGFTFDGAVGGWVVVGPAGRVRADLADRFIEFVGKADRREGTSDAHD